MRRRYHWWRGLRHRWFALVGALVLAALAVQLGAMLWDSAGSPDHCVRIQRRTVCDVADPGR